MVQTLSGRSGLQTGHNLGMTPSESSPPGPKARIQTIVTGATAVLRDQTGALAISESEKAQKRLRVKAFRADI
jgi:hypothetical protein